MLFSRQRKFILRWRIQLLCVMGGAVMYFVMAYVSERQAEILDGYLQRGQYGTEPVVYELVAFGANGDEVECQLEIRPQQYDEETAREVLDLLKARLPELILGENESLAAVRTNLNLINEFEEYGVQARWFSDEPEVLNSFGEIVAESCPEEGIPVLLTAELTAGRYIQEMVFSVCVRPKIMTEEELLRKELEELLTAAEVQSLERKEVFLPTEYRGKELQFVHKQEKDYQLFPVIGIVLAVVFYLKEKKDAEKVLRLRCQKLLLGYADVVYQFMVFTGAGLTVERSWQQIVQNYERRCTDGYYERHPAYEEMAVAYGKMQCGISEGKAIDEFGKGCGLQQYLKLSTLLNQNRKTGTQNLQKVLEQEMVDAWEQQKNIAKRMGEEAGTKLLVPLLLLLIIVMIVIMVPAMLALG